MRLPCSTGLTCRALSYSARSFDAGLIGAILNHRLPQTGAQSHANTNLTGALHHQVGYEPLEGLTPMAVAEIEIVPNAGPSDMELRPFQGNLPIA
jgi:hypothetical protein